MHLLVVPMQQMPAFECRRFHSSAVGAHALPDLAILVVSAMHVTHELAHV